MASFRKIAATYLFPGNQAPIKNGILVCRNDGEIIDIIDNNGKLSESHGVEFYSGIIAPGFVNAHCHLELSALKGAIEPGTGLGNFLSRLHEIRESDASITTAAMKAADRKMWANGIAAVADVSNSTTSLAVKKQSSIYYHTFAEAFGFAPERAERAFKMAKETSKAFKKSGLSCSITPHSAYSVSPQLFRLIAEDARQMHSILSVHHLESPEEKRLFQDGSGALSVHFKTKLKLDFSHWQSGVSDPTDTIIDALPRDNALLLVHNTFLDATKLKHILDRRAANKTHFCLCPNANLYIEQQLPPLELLRKNELNICLGTDSLASNSALSILHEMITLQRYFDDLPLEELLDWACLKGAKALDIDDRFGTLEPGKKPGINLITGVDFHTGKLTPSGKVKRLL